MSSSAAPVGQSSPRERGRRITVAQVRALARRVLASTRDGARAADRVLRAELEAIDRTREFVPAALREFQALLARVGVATGRPLALPLDDRPYWHRGGQPFADYRSHATIPESADIVIIGAGLVGASAAYHLASAARAGQRIVVLERGDPAGEASGRNGGNFELIPENSVGVYEGLASERWAFLERCWPSLPPEVLQAESERQASLVLGFALRNRDLIKQVVLDERIDCDLMPRGWLHLACNDDEEQGICDEVTLAAQHGQRIELWSRGKIRAEFGVETQWVGRFIPGDGTYHPFKYVCGLLECALRAGVELYTRHAVLAVHSDAPDRHRVVTEHGTIVARRVIAATNAFTSRLFPELAAIRPRQSQVMVTEHAPDRARGRVVTCEDGPVFFNQPRESARRGRAPVLMGGGADRPMRTPESRRRSPGVHATLLALRDRYYPELRGQPPSAEWIGPMAFTPDQLPALGLLRPGVVIAVACNGYGGSYTTAAGQAAAEMALTGATPEWLPPDVFSPQRLTSAQPMFLSGREGLWRIAASLCHQLHIVNRRISEALTLRTESIATAVPGQQPPRISRMVRASRVVRAMNLDVDPGALARLPVFAAFDASELALLARALVRHDLAAGTLLFAEGDPGGTCYVVVDGVVDVSVKVRGQPQLLAQLGPGSLFGQASLVEGTPRTASCSTRRDAVLASIDRDACERLLDDRSPVALKLLGALNQGLIAALRDADRRIMRLDLERESGGMTVTQSLATRQEPASTRASTPGLEHGVPLATI